MSTAVAGTDAINWWNNASLEEKAALCKNTLGWPAQYAEGDASLEWLTKGQRGKLQAVTWAELDAAEAAADEEG